MQVLKFSGLRIAACLLTALMVIAALGAATADARRADHGGHGGRDGVSGCRRCRDGVRDVRRDPMVMLSNGVVVEKTAVLRAPLSFVDLHFVSTSYT